MKLSTLLNAAFIASSVFAADTRKKLFEDLQATNYAGDVHELRWTTNQSYVRSRGHPFTHLATS